MKEINIIYVQKDVNRHLRKAHKNT